MIKSVLPGEENESESEYEFQETFIIHQQCLYSSIKEKLGLVKKRMPREDEDEEETWD